MNFRYGAGQMDHLCARDPALGAWIQKLGQLEWSIIPDVFEALMSSITAQQVSGQSVPDGLGQAHRARAHDARQVFAIPHEEPCRARRRPQEGEVDARGGGARAGALGASGA